MKNVLKGLELNEKDNKFTSFAKGGFKGFIGYATLTLPVLSTIYLIGKCVVNKEELDKFESEVGVE